MKMIKMGLILAAVCAAGLICHAAGTRASGFIVTFHLEGDETDSEKFVTPVKLGSEHRQYYFRKMPAFTNDDIKWFYPFVSRDGQSYGAAFRLHDTKAQELAGLTVANQGRLLGTRVLDAPLRAVVIDRPVNDGVVVIWEGLSQDHVKLIGTRISHVDEIRQGEELPVFDVPQASGQPGETKKPFQNLFKKR